MQIPPMICPCEISKKTQNRVFNANAAYKSAILNFCKSLFMGFETNTAHLAEEQKRREMKVSNDPNKKYIKIRGAKEHNLKDVSLDIPRDSL